MHQTGNDSDSFPSKTASGEVEWQSVNRQPKPPSELSGGSNTDKGSHKAEKEMFFLLLCPDPY